MQSLISDNSVVIAGPVYLEVLGACHYEKEQQEVKILFQSLPFLELTKSDFEEASVLKQKLRKQGVQTGNMDLLIAYLAIKNECCLLHRDKDFNQIGRRCHHLTMHPFSLK